jgi:hypothetical protein
LKGMYNESSLGCNEPTTLCAKFSSNIS